MRLPPDAQSQKTYHPCSMTKIKKDVQVGIYNGEYIVRVYEDKIILHTPEVRWIGNMGSYHVRRESIRDASVVGAVNREIRDGCPDTALAIIGRYQGDAYLVACGVK